MALVVASISCQPPLLAQKSVLAFGNHYMKPFGKMNTITALILLVCECVAGKQFLGDDYYQEGR